MKELEALKIIKEHYEFLALTVNNSLITNIAKEGLIQVDILAQALTPPTVEEVCQALTDEFHEIADYDKQSNSFWVDNGIDEIEFSYTTDEIYFEQSLTIETHKLVSKFFYEGGNK